MKRFILALILLFAWASSAYATDIAVASNQTGQIPFNPTNIGASRTFTVAVTSASATVTSAALFPSNIVGKYGFTVTIGSTYYTVAAVASTSSLTLTRAYSGSTGSATLTLFPYTLFRAYSTQSWQVNTSTSTTASVTVTNGSQTVTSSAEFNSQYIGVAGGFQILIDSVQYQVLWVASTSSLTLTIPYQGSSGAATATFNGVAENVQAATPGSGLWYKEMAVSVVNTGSGNMLYYPSFVIPATTDSPTNNQSRFVFNFYRTDNSLLGSYTCGGVSQLVIPTSTPTTWAAFCTYNSPGAVVPPNTEAYSKPQIDARFASCTSGQSYYFATNGNVVSCLNFGSGLTLTGNTLTASGGGGSGDHIIQGYNAVVDGGCDNTGNSNTTACLNAALIAANTAGRQFFMPAGTYAVNGFTLAGLNSQRIFGEGPGRTIITSTTGATNPVFFVNNASGLTHSLTIEELSFVGAGSGANDYGFRMSPDQPFDLTMRNVRITNVAQHGVYIPTNAFTMLFEGVDVSSVGGNGFDIGGDNTITLMRTYVHSVGTSGVAYRLHSGRFTLIGANGIDSGTTANWGTFGDNVAQDGVDQYARVTLIGCNVEAFTSQGIRFKAGSQLNVFSTNFVSPSSGTIAAIVADNMSGTNPGIFDALSAFNLNGTAAWTNGAPINSSGPPFVFFGVPGNTTYYDTTDLSLTNISYRTVVQNAAQNRVTDKFNRLALGTSTGEGFDGDLNFIQDDTRSIGTVSAGRPTAIHVGTTGITLASGVVPITGQNLYLAGGANPILNFNDGTLNALFQGISASYLQIGTGSAHDILFLTNSTGRWRMNSTGDFYVESGSLNLGKVGGNRPVNVYASGSLDTGLSGITTGTAVFRNSSNSNTLSLQAGATGSNLTFTLPTADGSASQCLITNGSGVLSFSACSAGSTAWSSLTAPVANLNLAMSTNYTTFTWPTGTSTNNMFTMQDTNGNTGTGAILLLKTVGTSTATPLKVQAQAADALVVNGDTGPSTRVDISTGNSATIGLRIIEAIGQTADTIRTTANNGTTVRFAITASTGQPTFGGIAYTFPSLPGSTQCMQMTSGGIIQTTGSGCGSSASAPAGSGSELQYRSTATTFGAVTSSSVSGAQVTLADNLTVSKNQNGTTQFTISNTTNGANAYVQTVFTASGRTYNVGAGATASGQPETFFIYDATSALNRLQITSAGRIGTGSTPTDSKLHVYTTSATDNALKLEIVGPNTGKFIDATSTANTTSSVQTMQVFKANANGTAAAGFGQQTLYQLESSTTDNQNAATDDVAWTTATHATRTARRSLAVTGNGTLAEALRLQGVAGTGVNYVQITPSITSSGPILDVAGSDSNIDFNINAKGTGILKSTNTGAATLWLNGGSDTSQVRFGAGSAPGNQGGIVFPFVGGANSSGPGIWWASSAAYGTTSGIYLDNGFTFQGASSTHDNIKFREATGSSSNGTTRYLFAPSSSLITQTLSTGVTNTTHDYETVDLSSTGTAAASFGAGQLIKLENGSGSQVNASRLSTIFTTVTAGSEVSKVVVQTNNAGAGLADAFTVEAAQYYGVVNAKGNQSGAVTVNFNSGNYVTITATGNISGITFSNIKAGARYVLKFTQDGTGGRTWTPGTDFKLPGGVAGNVLTAAANAVDVFVCDAFDTATLWCVGQFDEKNP